jgi:hypothetical protein
MTRTLCCISISAAVSSTGSVNGTSSHAASHPQACAGDRPLCARS